MTRSPRPAGSTSPAWCHDHDLGAVVGAGREGLRQRCGLERLGHDEDAALGDVAQPELDVGGLEARQRTVAGGDAHWRGAPRGVSQERRVTDPGAAELDDDAVALGIVADAAHELDGGPFAPEGQGHLSGQAGRHEGAVRPATLDPGSTEDDDHRRACIR